MAKKIDPSPALPVDPEPKAAPRTTREFVCGSERKANRLTLGDKFDLSVQHIIETSPATKFIVEKDGDRFIVTPVIEVGAH